jgi:flagellar M-ring protein FliF
MQLVAVEEARVHLVLPEKSLFLEQQEKTTASVVLKLAPGRRLSAEQVRGITHLVARSVEGLQAADVIIVDNNGQMLNAEEKETSFLSLTDAQLAYRKQLEQKLERQVEGLLEHAVGKGKVVVRVSVTPDFQHVERTEERYDADNPAVRSEQRSKEQGTGSGFWAIGVPGVKSNLTEDPQNPTPEKTSSARQQETINYELSKMVSKVVVPSGAIKQLSVAVLLDGIYQTDANGTQKYVPRSAEEMAKYREIVKGAVGYDETRGDRVEVANVPFEIQDHLEEEMLEKEARWAFWVSVSRYLAYIILGFFFFLFVVRPLIQRITGTDAISIETQLPRTVGELEADMGTAGMLEGAPESAAGESKPLSVRERVIELVQEDPERAAALVKAWLRGVG